MYIIQTTVYTFDELSEEAKKVAIEKHKEFLANEFDGGCTIEDAEQLGELLGISFDGNPIRTMGGKEITKPAIYWSGFWSQGDGACFEGSYKFAENAAAMIVEETNSTETALISIAQELEEVQKQAGFELVAEMKQRGHYMHSGCMSVNVQRNDDQWTYYCHEKAIAKNMRDFADWIYTKLQKEYEFTISDENVIENIKANEYKFTANGELI